MAEFTDHPTLNINVITALEAVRKRPTMYVGPLDNPNLATELAKQALCHALDEAQSGRCRWIRTKVFNQGRSFEINYDAPMSLEILLPDGATVAEALVSQLHACHNLKENMEVGDAYCTLGLAVLNAFSSFFSVRTGVDDGGHFYAYKKGVLIHENLRPHHSRGTSIVLALDSDFIGGCIDQDLLNEHLQKIKTDFPDLDIR